MKSVLYAGIDVHKESIIITVLRDSEQTPFIIIKKRYDPVTIRKYFEKLQKKVTVSCCYEAVFSGYALYRQLNQMGIFCIVAAPELIPRKPGERIKTDRRDAEKLASNFMAGMLTPIHVPTPSNEAVRDYLRRRDNFKSDHKRKKQQIFSFIAHLGLNYDVGKYWTGSHRKWLKDLDFDQDLHKEVLKEYLLALM